MQQALFLLSAAEMLPRFFSFILLGIARQAKPGMSEAFQGMIGMLISLALTIEGAALGMSSMGPSTNALMSCLFQAGYPCSPCATFVAARVAF